MERGGLEYVPAPGAYGSGMELERSCLVSESFPALLAGSTFRDAGEAAPHGLVVVMVVVAVMVVVPVSYLDDHLGIGGRIQCEKYTQRTQCEQTSLDVNVHERLLEHGFLRSNQARE